MGTGAVTNQVEWAQWSSVLNQEVDEIPRMITSHGCGDDEFGVVRRLNEPPIVDDDIAILTEQILYQIGREILKWSRFLDFGAGL